MLAGLAFYEMLSQHPWSAFQGSAGVTRGGSAAVCDPNPPRPFARYRFKRDFKLFFHNENWQGWPHKKKAKVRANFSKKFVNERQITRLIGAQPVLESYGVF